MKQIFLTLTCILSISYVSSQTIDMGITTPDGSLNTGVEVRETPNGVQMNMKMDTPDGSINMSIPAIEYSEDVETQINGELPNMSMDMNTEPNNGKIMMEDDYLALYSAMKNAKFDDERFTLGVEAIATNCISANQLKSLLSLFSFDDQKLELAKLAYLKVTNKKDFFTINDVFQFSDSIEQLTNFVMSVH